jgi:E3 ubiquitin-protein ligase ZSWIM2
MSVRSTSYQRTCSDAISWRQDQALNATIYILRETGPTGFLLKEDGDNKKHKVLISCFL